MENSMELKASKKGKLLGLDKDGIQKTMRGYHYFGDSLSQIALNSITGLAGMMTFFYTRHAGLAAATVGTILFIVNIIDALTDLIAGKAVDKTKSKYGKARPWFLWMAIPTALIIVGLFTVPVNASEQVRIGYALITKILATTGVFTFIAIPYGCMMATRTKSVEERSKMGIFRAICGYITGMVIAIALIPITNALGGTQQAWVIVAAVIGVIAGIAVFITFLTSKEENLVDGQIPVEKDEDADVPFKESIKMLFKNRYWVIMLLIQFFTHIMFAYGTGTGVFFARYILGDENLVAILGGIGLVPVVIGFLLAPVMFKKLGLVKTNQIAFAIGIGASIVRLFDPSSFVLVLVFGPLVTFATIPMMMASGALVNNTVEYNEWKYGRRIVGMTNSASSFGMKIGTGVGAASVGWILGLGGYDAALAVQPDSALHAIIALNLYVPLAIIVISFLILRGYDLESKYADIVRENQARKVSKAEVEDNDVE